MKASSRNPFSDNSRGQQLGKCLGTNASFYIRQNFNPPRIFSLTWQTWPSFIVLYTNTTDEKSCENDPIKAFHSRGQQTMQICWNKIKFVYEKRVQSPQDYKFMAAVSLSLANVTSFENDPVNKNHKGFLCWMLSADGASLGLRMSLRPPQVDILGTGVNVLLIQ